MGSKSKRRSIRARKAKTAKAEEAATAKTEEVAEQRAEAEARAEEDAPAAAKEDSKADGAPEDEAPAEKNDDGSGGEDGDEDMDEAAAEERDGSDGSTASSEAPIVEGGGGDADKDGREDKDEEEETPPPKKKKAKESKRKAGAAGEHDADEGAPAKKKETTAEAPGKKKKKRSRKARKSRGGGAPDAEGDGDDGMEEAAAVKEEGTDGADADDGADDDSREEATPKKEKEEDKESNEREADDDDGDDDDGASSPGEKAATDNDRRILMRGLPFKATEEEVRDFFADGGAPAPAEVELPLDKGGRPTGNAVLTFPSSDAADAALALNGKDFGDSGRWVAVVNYDAATQRAGGGPTPKPDGCTKVFVGNLGPGVNELTLRGLFTECGTVKEVKIPRRFKGYGHVEFEETDATDKAVALTGTQVMGRPVRVDYAQGRDHTKEKKDDKGGEGAKEPFQPREKPEGCRKIFVTNIPFDADRGAVWEVFDGCGDIRTVRLVGREGKHTGMGFVEFYNTEATDEAVKLLGTAKAEMDGRALRIDYAYDGNDKDEKSPKPEGCTRVSVGELPKGIDKFTLKGLFAQCGTVRGIKLPRKPRKSGGIVLVSFEETEATDKAVALSGTRLMGRPITVDYAKEKKVGGVRADGPSPKPEGCTRIFVKNLSRDIEQLTLKGVFAECGAIKEIKIPQQFKGFAYVEFEETGATNRAVKLSGTKVMGRPMKVDYYARGEKPEGCKKVFVANLPFGADEDAVQGAFEGCGEVRAVHLVSANDDDGEGERGRKNAGRGFVEFVDTKATDKAVAMRGTEEGEMDGRALRISYAREINSAGKRSGCWEKCFGDGKHKGGGAASLPAAKKRKLGAKKE